MSGAGNSSAGLSPFGTGTPFSSSPLADRVCAARKINMATGDYELADDGGFVEISSIHQRIILALTTNLGSCAGYSTFGNSAYLLKKLDASFNTRLKNAVALALNRLTEIEQVIRIENIDINRFSGGRVAYTVHFQVLPNGLKDKVQLEL